MNNPQKVILFSGGRTSGYMLRRLLDSVDINDYLTVFCNTGKEREETLDFVHKVESEWKLNIVWIEYHRVLASTIPAGVFPTERRNQNLSKAVEKGEAAHWFKQVDYKTASRKGEPFDELLCWASVLPNVVSRICSTQLKLRTAMRFLFSLGAKQYAPIIGIRKDEEHRATEILGSCDSFEYPVFPLVEWGVSQREVMEFWSQNAFDLKLRSYEGNCDLCFLKAKWKRVLLVRENPSMVWWWSDWEKNKAGPTGDGKFFRRGEPYSDLPILAAAPQQSEMCFVSSEKDIPCSCVERAFGPDDEDPQNPHSTVDQ